MEFSEKLINVSEASKMLSISRSKVHQMIKNEEIPYVKFDRHYKFALTDLLIFIEAKKRKNFK